MGTLRQIRWKIARALTDFRSRGQIRYQVTACLRFKNVARYLAEWVEFHHLVGVEHFYLYNNNSEDDYQSALAPYIRDGLVTLHEWPRFPASPGAEEHCVANYGRYSRWIAFLDDDEFLFPVQGGTLAAALEPYQAYPAVAVHWRMFGSNGHQKRPEGLVISNYTRTQEIPKETIKSIVNPRRILRAKPSTHYWIYKYGERAVDEQFTPVWASRGPGRTANVLRINHYWSKSYEDGLAKFSRGNVDKWGEENPRTMDTWREEDRTMNAVEETLILRYEAELKARLAARTQPGAMASAVPQGQALDFQKRESSL